jgi:hypothetical protein
MTALLVLVQRVRLALQEFGALHGAVDVAGWLSRRAVRVDLSPLAA